MMELGFYHAARGYWQTSGTPSTELLKTFPDGTVEVPLRPAADSEWDGNVWHSPPPDPVRKLSQARASAAVPRADFCNGLADIGLLTDDEAVAAAKGAWPAPMEMFLKYLDDRQRRDVQIEWATRATVERNHWAVLAMISFGIATEAQADTLCGIPDLGK